jgi:formate hydrogenlyase subunit 3/multisubunit Na+/H+ antiporter MnhD subunit
MKRNKLNTHFWRVLAAVNVLALIYPINLMHRAETADENLFAAFALIGVVFLLLTVDAVSMVARQVIGDTKH